MFTSKNDTSALIAAGFNADEISAAQAGYLYGYEKAERIYHSGAYSVCVKYLAADCVRGYGVEEYPKHETFYVEDSSDLEGTLSEYIERGRVVESATERLGVRV